MDTGSYVMGNVDQISHRAEVRLSLEGTVVVQRARELQGEARKASSICHRRHLARQRAFLREERRRARMEEELLRMEIADFRAMKHQDWIPADCLRHHPEKRVRLNVGGQV
ncbi:unnamed protein product, partial [Hapterophycus canaliculatus]